MTFSIGPIKVTGIKWHQSPHRIKQVNNSRRLGIGVTDGIGENGTDALLASKKK